MIGHFTAYYLNRHEFKHLMESGKKKFEPTYLPYMFVDIQSNLSEKVFEGFIYDGSYNNIIPRYLTDNNKRNNSIIQDYDKKESGLFTFDGIRFFKINNIATLREGERRLLFTFQFIEESPFTEKNTAFMIMPFRYALLNSFYKKNIKEYLVNSELNIQIYRSDDFTGTDVVADTILRQIKKAEFVICDITNNNKNVFFEIGFAKGLNKDIIFLLEQNKPADFFDVNHIRRIEYSYEREFEFQNLLKDTLLSIRANR
jgi:hypothetical protein